ncbi:MAG: hypothetical protein ACSHX9_12765 [Luteolibacter sp.]
MKIPIIIAALILIVGIYFRSSDAKRLADARESHAKLVEEARSLGISLDTSNPDGAALVTKRQRDDTEREAKDVAKEMIAFALEMEAMMKNGGEEDAEMQKRVADFMDNMFSLSASQLKIVIEEFRNSTELNGEMREGIIMFAIMTLAENHPATALTILTEAGDLADNEMISEHVLASSLASWAEKDPNAAMEWVRENGDKYPDLVSDDVKANLVKGAGENNMALAFSLIAELDMDDPQDALRELASVSKTAAERTEFVNLLREFIESSEGSDAKNNAKNTFASLADGIVKDGFESGSAWISENLSPQEASRIATTMGHSSKSAEKGKWINWMGENLPVQSRDSEVSQVVRNWTNNDYRAAGEWLAEQPAGKTKTAAISGYVKAISKYEPQTAVDWALTMPQGDAQQDALKTIYKNWPTSEEQQAARKAFAEKYGISQ